MGSQSTAAAPSQEAADSESGKAGSEGRGSLSDRKRVTGKEVVPSFDGEGPLREYRRRVDLFVATTGIDEEYRGGRLMEKLEGRAWLATQTMDVKKLRCANGVNHLLNHLQQELEPVEHLQTFQVLHEFFHSFKRSKGEEFVSFDTRFRGMLQKLDEIGAPLDGLVRSYWFLKCRNLLGLEEAGGGGFERLLPVREA